MDTLIESPQEKSNKHSRFFAYITIAQLILILIATLVPIIELSHTCKVSTCQLPTSLSAITILPLITGIVLGLSGVILSFLPQFPILKQHRIFLLFAALTSFLIPAGIYGILADYNLTQPATGDAFLALIIVGPLATILWFFPVVQWLQLSVVLW